MSFFSTRGGACVTASQSILWGLAKDGGLYVPSLFPQISSERLAALCGQSYRQRAARILQRFAADYGACGFSLLHADEHWAVESEKHADEIVAERNSMLFRYYEEAKRVLRANWAHVEKIADALVRRNTLIYEEIAALWQEAA